MKTGELVKYLDKIYEISEIKNDARGLWVRISRTPKSNKAIAAEGTIAECWFLSSSVEVIDEVGS